MALSDTRRSMCWHAARGMDTPLTPYEVSVLLAKIGGLEADLDAARAEGAALRAAGDAMAQRLKRVREHYREHDDACQIEATADESIAAWRALARPEPAAGEGSGDA